MEKYHIIKELSRKYSEGQLILHENKRFAKVRTIEHTKFEKFRASND